jgi:hypothetical protein
LFLSENKNKKKVFFLFSPSGKKKLLLTRQKTKKQKQKKNKKKITMASTTSSPSVLTVFPPAAMPVKLLNAYSKMNKETVLVYGQRDLTPELFRKHYLPVVRAKVEAGALFLLLARDHLFDLMSMALDSLNYKNVIVVDFDDGNGKGALEKSWGLYNSPKVQTEAVQVCVLLASSMVVFLFGNAFLDDVTEVIFFFLSLKFLDDLETLSKIDFLASLKALSRSESEAFRPLVIEPISRFLSAQSFELRHLEKIQVFLGGSPRPQADNTSSDEKKKTKSQCVCGKCP